MAEKTALSVEWRGSGRMAECPPNPAWPMGMDVDGSNGAAQTCKTMLPYPAPGCGTHLIDCGICGLKIGVTAAGRPDDPRSIKIACRIAGKA